MSFPTIHERRTFRRGVSHVSRADPRIRQLVQKHGMIEFESGGDPFESLVEAIISQQLNGQAARMIFHRLKGSFDAEDINPKALREMHVSKLRKAGVSPQKIRYLRDLSLRIVRGQLNLGNFASKPDDEIVMALDEVKGIGPWTAHMFLLFTLGRPDILPVGDLGIQTSIKEIYSLRKLPTAEKIMEIGRNWHPYCSVASLYLWHAKE